jgi:hypothetical protein
MAHDVFVSHSVKDKAVAEAIVARLEADSVTCWIAPRDVVPGADWGESIINAIESSRIMILLFSQSANASPQIKREVERAVNKGVYIIPFRLADIPPTRALEYFISTSQWMDAFSPPLERHLDNLAKTVKAVLTSPPLPKPLELPEPVGIDAPVTPVGRKGPVADGSTAHPSSRSRMAIIATVPALLILGAVAWYLGHKREVPSGGLPQSSSRPGLIASARMSEMEYGTNRFGGDYRSFEAAEPQVCQDTCAREAQCLAFTFVKPGVQRATGVCWLKDRVSPPNPDANCVSGIKK